MVCLNRPYLFKLFKGCLPQILLAPLLNTLFHVNGLRFRNIYNHYQIYNTAAYDCVKAIIQKLPNAKAFEH